MTLTAFCILIVKQNERDLYLPQEANCLWSGDGTEGQVNRMDRLNKVIADVAYICDVLISYRNILKSGDCNTCVGKCGDYKPKPGQMVRYNCPHFLAREEKQE